MAREFRNAALIILGILSAAMGLKGFLLSSNFIDGGVTGICMLLAKTTGVPLSVLLPVINLPFVAVGYRHMGAPSRCEACWASRGSRSPSRSIPFPDVTPDLVLTAVFGGLLLGAGIGLAIRGGAVLDGTEIAALLISRRADLLKVGDVILAFNVVLFLTAMSVLGVNAALYSILTYVSAARTLDFVIHGIDEFTAITVVSDASAAIREAITRRSRPRRDGLPGLRRSQGRRTEYPLLRGDAPRDRQGQVHRPGTRPACVRRVSSAGGRRRRLGEDKGLSLGWRHRRGRSSGTTTGCSWRPSTLYFQATQETLASIGIALTREDYIALFLVEGRGAWHIAQQRGVAQPEIERLRNDRNARYSELLAQTTRVIAGVTDSARRAARPLCDGRGHELTERPLRCHPPEHRAA